MRRLYVFRHGETDWNREGRIQGHLEVPLNELGRGQARALRCHIERLGIQAILSSDLGRAVETARLACERLEIGIHTDPRLREIHLGRLQGLTKAEIERLFGPEAFRGFWHNPISDADVARFGSEPGDRVTERALAAIIDFARAHPFEAIGVSTHGGVLRRLIQRALGIEGLPAPVHNGVIYPMELEPESGRLRLVGHLPLRR